VSAATLCGRAPGLYRQRASPVVGARAAGLSAASDKACGTPRDVVPSYSSSCR
jgi:hypothetical protein